MRDLKNMQTTEAPTKWMRFRVSLLGVVFFVLLLGVFGRAWNLQVNQKVRLKGFVSGQTVEVVDDDIGVDQVTHQFQPSRADAK